MAAVKVLLYLSYRILERYNSPPILELAIEQFHISGEYCDFLQHLLFRLFYKPDHVIPIVKV